MYHFYSNHHFDLTLAQVDKKAAQFQALKHPGDLAALLKTDAALVKKLAAKPHYFEFKIPKPGGAHRIIHNPQPDLKILQTNLNVFFQCAYYLVKPPCAYGFIPRPSDERKPRNIYFNALQHINADWVINFDLEDFFHSVNSRHLTWIFREYFGFAEPLAEQLIALCSCRGVLPMGAPTSPALSNFACLNLDQDLQQLANLCDGTYTRYADDMTFSLAEEPGGIFHEVVQEKVQQQQFTLNPKKTKRYGRHDPPEVTGLLLHHPKPDVSANWLKSLKEDIRLYGQLVAPLMFQRGIFHTQVLEKLRFSIRGQINFLAFIRGKEDEMYRKLAAFD